MKTINEIRTDLREIRYFYSKHKDFENASKEIGTSSVLDLANEYNSVIQNASARMYDLYVALYINNNTQAAVADDFGLTESYIRKLNKALCEYFFKEFNKEKDNDDR